MTPKLRIGIARLAHETNAYCPIPVSMDDFRRTHYLRSAELLAACSPGGHEVAGYVRRAELAGAVSAARRHPDVEVVPLVSAWTLPGGPVSRDAYDTIRAALLEELEAAGKLDGVLITLHGSMMVEGVADPETDLLHDVRGAVGQGPRIVVTFDLHAHLTPAKVAAADALLAYRTNPHRDHARVGFEGMELLVRMLRGEVRPRHVWRSLPMITGGGATVDFGVSMWPIFRRLARLRRQPGVLAASLFMCHPWSTTPDLGWAVHVLTDGFRPDADALADAFADDVWKVRHVDPPRPISAAIGIARIRRARWRRWFGCACIVDISDVAGAGSPGDGTGLLRALLDDARDLRCYVPIRDAEAIASLWETAPDTAVELDVGGKMTANWSPPVRVRGRIAGRAESSALGRVIRLDCGHVQLAITERLPFAIRPAFWASLGLSAWRADIVVVKSLFLWFPWFLPLVRQICLVQTAGPTDFDSLTRLASVGPVHPRDALDDWRGEDRRRRQLGST